MSSSIQTQRSRRIAGMLMALILTLCMAFSTAVQTSAVTTADEIIAYVPEHFSARLLYWLFHSKSVLVLKLADYLYRLIRICN